MAPPLFRTFKNHPAADLKSELSMCEKALMLDCRNFHCWDHRRSVAKLASLSGEKGAAILRSTHFHEPLKLLRVALPSHSTPKREAG